jgi:NAD-dependent DNA ligase
MIENKVGVGALVKVIRSGEIIPKIIEVVNGKKATLPSTKLFGEYEWDKTKTNLVCSGDNVEIQTRRMSRFFGKLGLDKIGSGFAEKLVAAGVAETQQAPKLSLEDIKSLPGIKSSAGSIYKELQRITSGEFTTVQLMDASGCFELGVGSTRLSALPKHLTAKDCRPTVADITAVPGLGTNFAEVYIAGFQKFNVWMKVCGAPWVDAKKAKSISGKLSGQNFSWTGYRSEEEENLVRSLGGSVVSFGSKTDVLFYTDGGKASSKVSKAGDKATTFKSFMNGK